MQTLTQVEEVILRGCSRVLHDKLLEFATRLDSMQAEQCDGARGVGRGHSESKAPMPTPLPTPTPTPSPTSKPKQKSTGSSVLSAGIILAIVAGLVAAAICAAAVVRYTPTRESIDTTGRKLEKLSTIEIGNNPADGNNDNPLI